jgi:hypothetical protein
MRSDDVTRLSRARGSTMRLLIILRFVHCSSSGEEAASVKSVDVCCKQSTLYAFTLAVKRKKRAPLVVVTLDCAEVTYAKIHVFPCAHFSGHFPFWALKSSDIHATLRQHNWLRLISNVIIVALNDLRSCSSSTLGQTAKSSFGPPFRRWIGWLNKQSIHSSGYTVHVLRGPDHLGVVICDCQKR